MTRTRLKIILKEVPENPILTTFIVCIIASIIILGNSFYYFRDTPEEYIKSILSEAHGMILDLLVIGVLLLWLNKVGEKQLIIKRNLDDIDDIRYWKSEEASFKIQGNIKRLLRHGIHNIDLHSCYIRKIKLNYCDLSYSNFNYADLSFSNLVETNFSHAQMNQTHFENANLNNTNFDHAILNGANFSKAQGVKTIFYKTKLIKADFRNAFLIDCNFQGAELAGIDFENTSLYMPDFSNTIGLTAEQLSKVKTLVKPKLSADLEAEIMEKFPELIKTRSVIKEA